MFKKMLSAFGFSLLVAGPAAAALDLQKSVLLSDAFGGSLAIETSGTVDIPGAETTGVAVFTAFHPGTEARSVDGEVTRNRQRNAEEVVSVYNGELTFSGPGDDGTGQIVTIAFDNLQVTRAGNGPEFSGTVILNGEVIDATEMPERVARILGAVLRFFHYA